MSQKEIELILARQLAESLATAIFIVDPNGNLLFYNEAAEKILGRRFGETGELSAAVWSTMFEPLDDLGRPFDPNQLPLIITLAELRPAHGAFWIHGFDNVRRRIEVTSFPLFGQASRYVGAIAIFWETTA